MEETLKVKLYFHICHISYNSYLKDRYFHSYDSYCHYFQTYFKTEYYHSKLPKLMVKDIDKIISDLYDIFGFNKDELYFEIFNFFNDSKWLEFIDIVKILNKQYNSLI